MNTTLKHRYLVLSKKVDAVARQARELFEVAEELAAADPDGFEFNADGRLRDLYTGLDDLAEELAQRGGA